MSGGTNSVPLAHSHIHDEHGLLPEDGEGTVAHGAGAHTPLPELLVIGAREVQPPCGRPCMVNVCVDLVEAKVNRSDLALSLLSANSTHSFPDHIGIETQRCPREYGLLSTNPPSVRGVAANICAAIVVRASVWSSDTFLGNPSFSSFASNAGGKSQRVHEMRARVAFPQRAARSSTTSTHGGAIQKLGERNAKLKTRGGAA